MARVFAYGLKVEYRESLHEMFLFVENVRIWGAVTAK